MLAIEALYLATPLANFFLADAYLGNDFNDYGTGVVQYASAYGFNTGCYQNTTNQSTINTTREYSPMDKVFPTMSECIFHTYGFSGTVQKTALLCVLPMNVINSKVRLLVKHHAGFFLEKSIS